MEWSGPRVSGGESQVPPLPRACAEEAVHPRRGRQSIIRQHIGGGQCPRERFPFGVGEGAYTTPSGLGRSEGVHPAL